MMKAYDHAVNKLGLSGVVMFLGPENTPPDDPMYEILYEACEKNDTPIWIHPNRPPTFKDYTKTNSSQYAIWNSLGWVYDTSVGKSDAGSWIFLVVMRLCSIATIAVQF